jgi:hypothetical protein
MSSPNPKQTLKWWVIVLVVPFTPVLVAIALLALVFYLGWAVCLHVLVWSWWCIRGRDVLFVYSDSPIWHDYIEEQILPYLGERAVVLNWSGRRRWRLSLAKMAFYRFGTYRQFNPLAVVFRPLRRSRVFRFWQPFRDFKHGHAQALNKMEKEFFELIGVDRHSLSG